MASPQRRRLDRSPLALFALFAHVAELDDPNDALAIEDHIWAHWMSDLNVAAAAALDLAIVDIAAGRYDIPEIRLVELTRSRPDLTEAWHKLGVLYAMLERRKGLQMLRRALEREPRHYATIAAVGDLLH